VNPGLEPPDTHHLLAAEGWLGLGCWEEARAEWDKLRPVSRAHSDALRVRCEIHGAAKEWELCFRAAATLVDREPEAAVGWIQRSYALHELQRTPEAYRLLLEAVERFPKCHTVAYNLACYTCQLGMRDEAWRWFSKALALGGTQVIKSMALEDRDLQPFWSEIQDL